MMAITSQTYLAHNVVGNRREDYIEAATDDGSGTVKTRLKVIDNVLVSSVQLADQSVTVAITGGSFIIVSGSAGTYRFLVEGN
jgi:hypothetical protein